MTTKEVFKQSGQDTDSTNNRMELFAVIKGVEGLSKTSEVWIYSDSQYIVRGINQWRFSWDNNDWCGVKNPDLWQKLHTELNLFTLVRAVWIKGHSGHPENDECDRMAANAREGRLGSSARPGKAPVKRKRYIKTRKD